MNYLYDKFMKARPHVFTPLPAIAPHTRSPLNKFQKRLLKDGEFGYFEKKARQEGATTALAAFASFYIYTYPESYVLYLADKYTIASSFKRLVSRDWFDNYITSFDPRCFIVSTLESLDANIIGYTFGLVIIDEVNGKKVTNRHISELAAHDTLNTIWLSTTNMI